MGFCTGARDFELLWVPSILHVQQPPNCGRQSRLHSCTFLQRTTSIVASLPRRVAALHRARGGPTRH